MVNQLLTWYHKNKRDLPWRKTSDPYKIWVSEIILQQTQIKTGTQYYNIFIKKFPNVESLALAEEIDILKIWEGLGYYTRAINMLSTAKKIKTDYNGRFPSKYDELIKLRGIGQYTASAISSICFDEKKAVVDGNVYRVLTRLYNVQIPINTNAGKKKIQKIADGLIPSKDPGTYNQAIMDFGSMQCKKNNPKCNICPLKKKCKATKLNLVRVLPIKKLSKKITLRYFNYLFITDLEYFLIKQRKTNDIWKKLYELPLIESKEKIDITTLEHNQYLNQFNVNSIQYQYETNHILSHQKLIITFWEVKINNRLTNNRCIKINKKDINRYPFPKPLQTYFNKGNLKLSIQ